MSDTITPAFVPARSVVVPTAVPGGVGATPFTDLAWTPKCTAESGWWWVDATNWCAEINDVIGQGAVAVIGPDNALVAAQLNWTAYPTKLGILLQGGTPGAYYTVCPTITSSRDSAVEWAGEIEMSIAGSITYQSDPSMVTLNSAVVLLGGVPFPTGTQPTGPVQPATEMQAMPPLSNTDLPNAQFPVLLPPLSGSTVSRVALASGAQVGSLAGGSGGGGDEQSEITALQASMTQAQENITALQTALAALTSNDQITLDGQTAAAPYQVTAALSVILDGTGYLQVSAGFAKAVLNGTTSAAPVMPPTGNSWGNVGINEPVFVLAGQMATFFVLPNGLCVVTGA